MPDEPDFSLIFMLKIASVAWARTGVRVDSAHPGVERLAMPLDILSPRAYCGAQKILCGKEVEPWLPCA